MLFLFPKSSEYRLEFKHLFDESGPRCGEIAKQLALSSSLKDCFIRGIVWKFFLGLVLGEPGDSWVLQLSESRNSYNSIKDKLLIDPHTQKEIDLETDNPLSTSQDSAWNKFFDNKQVENQLDLDLSRLFPEYPFFHRKSVINTLRTVLFVWIRENPQLCYVQGMHEIVGGLYYVFSQVKCRSSNPRSCLQ